MRTIAKLTGAGLIALFGAFNGESAQSAPLTGLDSIQRAALGLDEIEQTQFFFGGRQFCFYPNGWRGPGWYWCGYHLRRGLGWGGPSGWRGWRHRHGHVHIHRGGPRHFHGGDRHFRGGDRHFRGGERHFRGGPGGGRMGMEGGRRDGGAVMGGGRTGGGVAGPGGGGRSGGAMAGPGGGGRGGDGGGRGGDGRR